MNRRFLLTLASLLAMSTYADADEVWRKVPVPHELTVAGVDGQTSTLHPSCSGGPACSIDPTTGNPTSCKLGNTDFSFYYHRGKNRNLVVFFQKGGTCWDAVSCLATAATATPLYKGEIPPEEHPAQAGGILDLTKTDNPFRQWSFVYIPSCTGDLHWGSKDTAYQDPIGIFGGPVTIHHRGRDNMLAVLDWVKHHPRQLNFDPERKRKSKLTVAGSSAGGYGALINYTTIRETWPKTEDYLLVDAANGVLTEDFMQAVIGNPESPWNHRPAFPPQPEFQNLLNSGPELFEARYFDLIANQYSRANGYGKTHMGQYTTAFDASQTTLFNIIGHIGNPAVWSLTSLLQSSDPLAQAQAVGAFCQWHGEMQKNVFQTAESIRNYRYYIGAGTAHTALVTADFNGAPFAPPDAFYNEQSADQPLRDWVNNMLKHRKDWKSASCTGATCAGQNPPFVLPFDPALCPSS